LWRRATSASASTSHDRPQIVRDGVDVAEDGGDLLPAQGVSSGDERERRNDHFTLELKGTGGDLQRNRRIAHGDAVPHADEIADLLLELQHEWTVVGKPAAIEHVVDASEEFLAIADVGAADVEFFREGGGAAQEG